MKYERTEEPVVCDEWDGPNMAEQNRTWPNKTERWPNKTERQPNKTEQNRTNPNDFGAPKTP